MSAPRLPAAVLAAQSQASVVSTASGSYQVTVAGDGAIIPVIYGRQSVGARIFAVGQDPANRYLALGLLWCAGPVDAIEGISIGGSTLRTAGPALVHYPGATDQPVDSWLAALIEGYADRLVASVAGAQVPMAYSVFKASTSSALSDLTAVVRGRKLYDPRTATTAYSRNPALALADWITNPVYGQGLTVDWDSVAATAELCDEALADDTARRELDLVIADDLPAAQWADILRTYAGCFLAYRGDGVVLVPDRPCDPTRALTPADMRQGSFRLARLSARNRPTVVEVSYTDNTTRPWSTVSVTATDPRVASGAVPRLVESVSLPGITRRAQAYREAVERLNAATLTNLSTGWETFDEAAQDLIGDVVTVTHPLGLSAQPMRITEVAVAGIGRYQLSAVNYDADIYSDSLITEVPAYAPIADPYDLPTLTGVSVASGSDYLWLGLDGTVFARAQVSWTPPPDYPYPVDAVVTYQRAGDELAMVGARVAAAEGSALVGPLSDGAWYTFRVALMTGSGVTGEAATVEHQVIGKTEPPPSLTTFEVAAQPDGTRQFTWSLTPTPLDYAGVQIRYTSGSSGTWASMTPLHEGLLRASPYEANALAAGVWYFAARAVDTSGNASTTELTVTTTLPDPRLAGVLDYIDVAGLGWPGTKSNCWVDGSVLYATDTGDWADLATGTWADWTGWVQDANDCTYTHSVIDLAATTLFTPLVTASVIAGTALIEERYHDTDIDSGTWATAAGQPITTRYYQARVTVSGAAGDVIGLTGLTIILNAKPIEEAIEDLATSGLSSTYRSAAGDVRLPIASTYAAIRTVSVTLQSVGPGWTWELIDKDTTVGPRIKIYNSSGTLADATIDALIRGL